MSEPGACQSKLAPQDNSLLQQIDLQHQPIAINMHAHAFNVLDHGMRSFKLIDQVREILPSKNFRAAASLISP
jgi:hypothetical protein